MCIRVYVSFEREVHRWCHYDYLLPSSLSDNRAIMFLLGACWSCILSPSWCILVWLKKKSTHFPHTLVHCIKLALFLFLFLLYIIPLSLQAPFTKNAVASLFSLSLSTPLLIYHFVYDRQTCALFSSLGIHIYSILYKIKHKFFKLESDKTIACCARMLLLAWQLLKQVR